MRTKKLGFREDIEGLRAVAVLLVVAYHAHLLGCKGGFVGVDVFFVISGYLITGLLTKEIFRDRTIALVQFYARRIRRLLPASLLMLLGVTIAAHFILPPYEQSLLSESLRSTIAYLSNFHFAWASNDYFATTSGDPLLHTWSLAVEEQFYFVWPIMIALVYRLRPSRRALCLVMAAIGLLSFAGEAWLTKRNQPMGFFLMPPRAWEFAVGGLAGQVPSERLRNSLKLTQVLGWIGLTMVVVSGLVMSPIGFPGVKAALPVLGTAAMLVAGAAPGRFGVGALLSKGPLQYIGQRSYAIYLWHWPVLILTSVLVDPFSLQLRLLCVAASLGLAELTYRLIENPIRFNLYLQRHASLCVTAALMIVLVGAAGARVLRHWAIHTVSYAKYGKAMMDIPEDFPMGCESGFRDSTVRECDFGSSTPSKIVVLFGDSHIEQWLPAFHAIADRKNWRIVLFVKSSCPALAISAFAPQSQGEDRSCGRWRALAIHRIEKLHPAAIVLSNATSYLEADRPQVAPSLQEWRRGAHKTFAALEGANVPLVFLRDTPWARYNVTQCLSREDWNGRPKCPPLPRSTALNEAVFHAQMSGSEDLPNIAFIDLSDRICGNVSCDLVRGQTIIYRDDSHLTATFLRSLSTDLYDELVRVVPALAS